ncbi:MAG: hypothetical protein RMJ98_20655 [Myxococcales bacterium]|nr:hypothetical protein [Polyangiaceae bacterium]MDW8251714.1 hypothetical protein [Myxococcales bacterium]
MSTKWFAVGCLTTFLGLMGCNRARSEPPRAEPATTQPAAEKGPSKPDQVVHDPSPVQPTPTPQEQAPQPRTVAADPATNDAAGANGTGTRNVVGNTNQTQQTHLLVTKEPEKEPLAAPSVTRPTRSDLAHKKANTSTADDWTK